MSWWNDLVDAALAVVIGQVCLETRKTSVKRCPAPGVKHLGKTDHQAAAPGRES